MFSPKSLLDYWFTTIGHSLNTSLYQIMHEYPPFWILHNLMTFLYHNDIMSAKVNIAEKEQSPINQVHIRLVLRWSFWKCHVLYFKSQPVLKAIYAIFYMCHIKVIYSMIMNVSEYINGPVVDFTKTQMHFFCDYV